MAPSWPELRRRERDAGERGKAGVEHLLAQRVAADEEHGFEPARDAVGPLERRGRRPEPFGRRQRHRQRAEKERAEPGVEPFPRGAERDQDAIAGCYAARGEASCREREALDQLGIGATLAGTPATVDQRDAAIREVAGGALPGRDQVGRRRRKLARARAHTRNWRS